MLAASLLQHHSSEYRLRRKSPDLARALTDLRQLVQQQKVLATICTTVKERPSEMRCPVHGVRVPQRQKLEVLHAHISSHSALLLQRNACLHQKQEIQGSMWTLNSAVKSFCPHALC
jgi:hypothetical protein